MMPCTQQFTDAQQKNSGKHVLVATPDDSYIPLRNVVRSAGVTNLRTVNERVEPKRDNTFYEVVPGQTLPTVT